MVRSLNADEGGRAPVRLSATKKILRDARPWLAIIAAFAAVALLIDFCFVCIFQAIR